MIWYKPTRKDGPVPVRLTNFVAEIVEQIREDDGTESRLLFEIEAKLNRRCERFRVTPAEFRSMTWVLEQLGAEAIVYPRFMEQYVAAAIQELSGEIPRRTVFTHIGWQKVEERWVYLHAGGAVGQEGAVPGIEVNLPEPLRRFDLPSPPRKERLAAILRRSLRWLDVGPRRVTIPLFAAVYRAILGGANFSLHISGGQGFSRVR